MWSPWTETSQALLQTRQLQAGRKSHDFEIFMLVLKGLGHTICYLFKKLQFFPRQMNSKNNGPVLLFKTMFRYWNCFRSSVATDGQGLKLKKIGSTFFKF